MAGAMLVFDAHLDLSLNALEYNRDLRGEIAALREKESGMTELRGRGSGTVSFPEMRRAGIGLCVATQIGGCMQPPGPVASWNSPPQAWAMTQGQLAWYRAMEEEGHLRQLRHWDAVSDHLREWAADPVETPIGYLLSLEGADSLRTLDDLHRAHGYGLRALGPAHYGAGRYALGHDRSGPLTPEGRDLLREMDSLGIILDVTHLCEETFWDALECFEGPVWASHHNCRALVDDPRQLSDEQILALAQRGAVVGLAFDVWMIAPGWDRSGSTHANFPGATLEALADHADHICQLVGNIRHLGIGSDLDGGFGREQSPADLETIGDLGRFFDILEARGYSREDIEAIAHRNFLRFLEDAWRS